ncbi:MAG: ABC transporter permease [Lacunisphaera sp.]|nr:ABC transporter permease [Lacunisphaera sp.]
MIIATFLQDLRIGLRVLIKEKSFCALAVFVLALGICAVTAQFAVVNGVVLRGFSFPHSEQLVSLQLIDPKTGNGNNNFNGRVTGLDYEDLSQQAQSYTATAAYLNQSTINLTINGTPQRLTGAYVTDRFFSIVGVAPVLGRDFLPEDNQPGAPKVVIIGHQVWERDFSSNPAVIGQTVRVNGRSATVIGVMPRNFQFPISEQLWVPLFNEFPVKPRNDPLANNVAILARLKPASTVDQAQLELTTIAKNLAAAYPDTNKDVNAGQVQPLIQSFTGPQLRGLMFTMLGFCVGVLLIACVNVMNMQFARATLRAKELAIRSSLGATRGRLVRQMLTESLLVATLGATIGIALAYWAVDLLFTTTKALPFPLPYWITFEIDGRVLLFTVGATVTAALVSGLIPAWLASRANASEVLKESGRGNTGRFTTILTRGLVIFQIVITAILLVGSLLQVKSILRQQNIDYGYDTGAVYSARMGLFEADYPTAEAKRLFYERVLRELRASPEFEAAAFTTRFRMTFSGNGPIEIEGKAYAKPEDRPQAEFESVTDGFFATLGMKLLEGRDFTSEESDQKLPVAIVNAGFAKKYFGPASALGRRFRTVANNERFGPWRTIIGVVSEVRMAGPFNSQSDNTGFYAPMYVNSFGPAAAGPIASQFATIIVRLRGQQAGENAAAPLRRVIQKIDPNLPLYFAGVPRVLLSEILAQNRIVAVMFSAFGAVAMLLAAVGLYGVMSFSVNQRTHEFGIRMALGADHGRILKMVFGQSAWQLGSGLAAGLGLALVAAILGQQGISNFLFKVSPTDPATYLTVFGLLSAVAFVATLVPARRATRVDPMIALRAE